MQFASNYLGRFALVLGLRRALASATGARVVSESATGHVFPPLLFDDLHFRLRPYDPWAGYDQSKTASAILAVELTRRWADESVVTTA